MVALSVFVVGIFYGLRRPSAARIPDSALRPATTLAARSHWRAIALSWKSVHRLIGVDVFL